MWFDLPKPHNEKFTKFPLYAGCKLWDNLTTLTVLLKSQPNTTSFSPDYPRHQTLVHTQSSNWPPFCLPHGYNSQHHYRAPHHTPRELASVRSLSLPPPLFFAFLPSPSHVFLFWLFNPRAYSQPLIPAAPASPRLIPPTPPSMYLSKHLLEASL